MFNFNTVCITITIAASLFLTGCGEEKLRTADYYRENPDKMEKMLEKCSAEKEKGYKPEGNFGENCDTAFKVKLQRQRNMMMNAIMGN